MKYVVVIVLVIGFFSFSISSAFADSPYVLPYPSFMPGTTLYKVDKIVEFVQKYWYFGDFGQFIFSLKESDKYLVEAKTLFEYKQYLLAESALEKSNTYFLQTEPALKNALRHGKNISEFQTLLDNAAEKHMEVLRGIEQVTPSVFVWSPEKTEASTLSIYQDLENAIKIRKSI